MASSGNVMTQRNHVAFGCPAPAFSDSVQRLVAAAEAEDKIFLELAKAIRRCDHQQTFLIAEQLIAGRADADHQPVVCPSDMSWGLHSSKPIQTQKL